MTLTRRDNDYLTEHKTHLATDQIPFTKMGQKLITVQPLFSFDLTRSRSPIQEALIETFGPIDRRILMRFSVH